jgi:trypsin
MPTSRRGEIQAGVPARPPRRSPDLRRARQWYGASAALACALGCGSTGGAFSSNDERSAVALELGQGQQPIIGGSLDEATAGVVGLALDLGPRGIAGHCSGTLIAPNLVLTARHCVAFTDEEGAAGIVECGTTEFDEPFPADALLASPKPVRPTDPDDPSYVRGREIRTLGGAGVCGFDIALIILEGAGVPASIQPILPRLELAPRGQELFSTVGYGLTVLDDPASDGTRQRADGSAVRCSREECVALSDGAIRNSEWASVDAPICSGDSGGPALDEQGRVFGVASRGDLGCEIAVYGDVSSFGEFIVDTALYAAELGEYTAPSWATEGAVSLPAEVPTPAALTDDPSAPQSGCSLVGSQASGQAGRPALSLLLLVALGWLGRQRQRGARARSA